MRNKIRWKETAFLAQMKHKRGVLGLFVEYATRIADLAFFYLHVTPQLARLYCLWSTLQGALTTFFMGPFTRWFIFALNLTGRYS